MGEMAMKRQQIIRKLEEEGVFTMNKELEMNPVPQRIAVISSKNAAGYTDFVTHLSSNKYGYVFYVALFEAAMQGSDTEQSVTDAMNRISENAGLFDAVAIIRGGGSQTDLSWFDNYNIAYHITQFPIPVITGIGHEKDLSVTDLVAWRSEKTPTATADFLISTVVSFEENILGMASEIISQASEVIKTGRKGIETARLRLIPLARMRITSESAKLSEILRSIRTGCRSFIKENDSVINNLAASVSLLDPKKILKRGYTITSFRGKILISADEAKNDENIETTFSDGVLTSKITGRSMTKKSD
jgi:exodeoxyribonuclease VII large subunit